MTLTVLLDNVTDVVRFPSLLKLSASHEVLDLSDCPDSVSMCLCQPVNNRDSRSIPIDKIVKEKVTIYIVVFLLDL